MGYEAKLSLKQAPVLALNAVLLHAIELHPMVRQELVDAIQRELTENPMLEEKVAISIVKLQREFFEHGLAHLKPLVFKDVAEDIGMHEFTVSRITTNKYMDTERGLFELKVPQANHRKRRREL